MADQICLIKSIISALPLFYFSFFKAPIAVCNQIRRIQARFLWGWGFEGRKIAWVKWEKVCSSVAAGGLGIKDIGCFNDALLTKWKWRFVIVEEGFWIDILEARYGSWRNMNISLEYRNQSLWWKDLCRTCGKGIQSNWFDCRSKWILGDGRCVKFWEDRWAEDRVLKEKLPRLFMISTCKDSLVSDLVDPGLISSGGCQSWNLGLRRERFAWEKCIEEQLLGMISKVQWNLEGKDRLIWVGNDDQDYTVKSGYMVLNKEDSMQSDEVFQLLWSLKIPPSTIVCAWRILLDRLPTRANLGRRGVQLGNACCPLCHEGVEPTQHLFSSCKVT